MMVMVVIGMVMLSWRPQPFIALPLHIAGVHIIHSWSFHSAARGSGSACLLFLIKMSYGPGQG